MVPHDPTCSLTSIRGVAGAASQADRASHPRFARPDYRSPGPQLGVVPAHQDVVPLGREASCLQMVCWPEAISAPLDTTVSVPFLLVDRSLKCPCPPHAQTLLAPSEVQAPAGACNSISSSQQLAMQVHVRPYVCGVCLRGVCTWPSQEQPNDGQGWEVQGGFHIQST